MQPLNTSSAPKVSADFLIEGITEGAQYKWGDHLSFRVRAVGAPGAYKAGEPYANLQIAVLLGPPHTSGVFDLIRITDEQGYVYLDFDLIPDPRYVDVTGLYEIWAKNNNGSHYQDMEYTNGMDIETLSWIIIESND
jgi:hypothetical protein